MKYSNENIKSLSFRITWLNISKFIFFLFLVYMNWYKEIWGDKPIILYGSVIALTVSLMFSEHKRIPILESFNEVSIYKVLFFFGIYCFISGFIVCKNRSVFVSSMITYFCYLVVLFDCCLIARHDRGWNWLLQIFIFVALICGIWTILYGKPRLNGHATVITLGHSNNPNALAHVLLIGIFALVTHRNKETKNLLLSSLGVIILLYSIILTGSRKALISTIAFLLIWLYSFIKIMKVQFSQNTKRIAMIIIALSIIAIIWYFRKYYMHSDQFSRLLRLFGSDEDSANEDRIKMYELAIKLWREHPIFGVGFNQFKFYSWRGDYSHSVYAEALSCTGLIGTSILFLPIIYNLFLLVKSIRRTIGSNRYYITMCFAGVITELFLGVGQIWFYGISHELYLLSIFGIFENIRRNELYSENNKIKEFRKCKYII